MRTSVQNGLEQLFEDTTLLSSLKSKKIALLSNQAAVNGRYQHLADLLHLQKIPVVRYFAPEHGFRGELQDMETVETAKDPYTDVEIVSLYGSSISTLMPEERYLEDIDVLIADLQDIGARYYTYAQTLGYCMAVAQKTNTQVIVLDRPNPINGITVEGALLTEECRSFCGELMVPNRHGLTLGELAQLMNKGLQIGGEEYQAIGCKLEVISCNGWRRDKHLNQTDHPWVAPSPNMPTLDTAFIYPGSCLFEGTELSEGRGTTKPLEIAGAPYIDGKHWAEHISQTAKDLGLRGAVMRPLYFVPKFQKHAGNLCGGVQLHVTDMESFQSMRWAMVQIWSAKQLYPEDFAWRKQAFEFVDKVPAIDLLYGTDDFRKAVDIGGSLQPLFESMSEYENTFVSMRNNGAVELLY